MDVPIKRVAAIVLQAEDKVWLIKYNDEPGWPWQLVNVAHDGNPERAIKKYLESEYGLTPKGIIRLDTKVIEDLETKAPLLEAIVFYARLNADQKLMKTNGITPKLVPLVDIDRFGLSRLYSDCIKSAQNI